MTTETDPDFMTDAQLVSRRDQANFDNAVLYRALDAINGMFPVLHGNLRNQGLTAPECPAIYRAVLEATNNNAALAWEGARRQQLLWLRKLQQEHAERYTSMRSDVYHFTVNHRDVLRSAGDRAIEIARVATMANPFALEGAAQENRA